MSLVEVAPGLVIEGSDVRVVLHDASFDFTEITFRNGAKVFTSVPVAEVFVRLKAAEADVAAQVKVMLDQVKAMAADVVEIKAMVRDLLKAAS